MIQNVEIINEDADAKAIAVYLARVVPALLEELSYLRRKIRDLEKAAAESAEEETT